MEKVINSNETIFEPCLDVIRDNAIDSVSKVVRDNLHTKLHNFLGNKIFKTMLELSPENSLEKVEKHLSKIADHYFLNVDSQENESAIAELYKLCME